MSIRYIPVKIRIAVIDRGKGRCEYCQCWAHNSTNTFCIDHIIPISKDGKTILLNLAYSCYGCNGYKLDKILAIDPQTQQEVSIFNPRTDKWNEHFKWSDDALQMIGQTAIGRATINCLRLNREGVINIRRLTILSGEHPPKD